MSQHEGAVMPRQTVHLQTCRDGTHQPNCAVQGILGWRLLRMLTQLLPPKPIFLIHDPKK